MTDVDDIELKLKKYSINNTSLLKFKQSVCFDSIKSDLVCIEYSDKIFLSISSNGRFGAVLIAKSEKISGLDESVYTVKNLFGQFEQTFQIFARSLAEKLKQTHSVSKPLVITIGVSKDQVNRIDLFKDYETRILEFFNKSN